MKKDREMLLFAEADFRLGQRDRHVERADGAQLTHGVGDGLRRHVRTQCVST
jgi:hypothetical protein